MSMTTLDALVAEKVMGLRFWKETRGEYTLAVCMAEEPWKRTRWDCQEKEKARYTEIDSEAACTLGFFANPPRYSSDMDTAWNVVIRMRELGRHFLLMVSHESALAIASFYLGPHDRIDLSATDTFDNAPTAICRAALKAVKGMKAI